MKLVKTCLILSLLLGTMASANSFEEETVSLKNTSSIARKIIFALPNSRLKDGLNRFYSILKPDSYYSDVYVGTKNDGIQIYLENSFNTNPCFAETAYRFYDEIKQTTLNRQDDSEDISRHSRASFGDISGVTRNDRPAGWLFQRAMKYTQGDANKAVALIGLCGHDDINQGHFVNNEAASNIYNKYGINKERLYSNPTDDEYVDLDENSICPPRTSDFYLSRALSKDADISDALKDRILKVQYPGRRPIDVASKNYHILNAAFMTCQMIETGMHPRLAQQVEIAASNLYRGVRLCSDIRTPAKVYSELLKIPAITQQFLKGTSIAQAIENVVLDTIHKGTCKNKNTDGICRYIDFATLPVEGSRSDLRQEVRETVKSSLPQMLASRLYLDWHAGGSFLGADLPCSKIKISGPSDFFKHLVLNKNSNWNFCGSNISQSECKEAMQIMETWRIDFDWTISQHRAGSEFAVQNCRFNPKATNSFQHFCK